MKGVVRKEYNVVCVWSLDRMGRSLIDLVNILAELDAKNVGFYSHKQALDTTTPSGRLMFSIVGAMAEYERSIIRERVMAGLEAARARGKRLGRPSKAQEKTPEVIRLRKQGWGMTRITCGARSTMKARCSRFLRRNGGIAGLHFGLSNVP
jgi:DNA invertase Pin-like site-specific DNA recombinase